MKFEEKLIELRKQKGLSQEQLANQLGVTRQSVSKWESGSTLPELAKIMALSEIFDVSVDYLVKDQMECDSPNIAETKQEEAVIIQNNPQLEEMVGEIHRYMKGYQYTSKTKIFGFPLVSINLSRRMGKQGVAKGIIAIGNVAIGVISFGLVSVGVVSIGCIGIGLAALGAMAAGVVSFGAVAIGIFAFGSVAIGVYAGGVAVYGSQIAVGVVAKGHTAIGESAHGINELQYYKGIPEAIIRDFIQQHHPKLWEPIREFFTVLGTSIK